MRAYGAVRKNGNVEGWVFRCKILASKIVVSCAMDTTRTDAVSVFASAISGYFQCHLQETHKPSRPLGASEVSKVVSGLAFD